MPLLDHETAIIDHLKAEIDTPVESFPDSPSTYVMNHPTAVILVIYHGSNFAQNNGGNVVVQNRRTEWDLIIVSRNLKTHVGAYDVLDQVRTAMTGFQISGCSKVYPIREQFLNESGGIWQYGLTVGYEATHKEV